VQVCIGLVVTPEGLPLAHEVFDGNRTDVTTVEEIVEAMEKKYGHARRTADKHDAKRGQPDSLLMLLYRKRDGHQDDAPSLTADHRTYGPKRIMSPLLTVPFVGS